MNAASLSRAMLAFLFCVLLVVGQLLPSANAEGRPAPMGCTACACQENDCCMASAPQQPADPPAAIPPAASQNDLSVFLLLASVREALFSAPVPAERVPASVGALSAPAAPVFIRNCSLLI